MIRTFSQYLFLSIIALFLATLVLLSTTNIGLKLSIEIITHIAPGKIQIQLTSGALNREINIKQLSYKNKTLNITANDINLKLQPLALLLNDIRVSKLHIKHLNINYRNQTKKTNNPPHFKMPIKLILQNVSIDQIIIKQNKTDYQFNRVKLNGLVKSNLIVLTPMRLQHNNFNYKLNGRINFWQPKFHLTLSCSNKNKVNFTSEFNGQGTWTNIQINGKINSLIKVKMAGHITNILTYPNIQFHGIIVKKFPSSYQSGEFDFYFHKNSTNKTNFLSTLKWKNIELYKQKRHYLTSPQGEISIKGNLHTYKFSAKTFFDGTDIPSNQLTFQGTGNSKKLIFNKINIDTLSGLITGNGHIDFGKNLNYQINLQGEHLNPQLKWQEWPGNISFLSVIQGKNNVINVNLFDLHGTLRSRKIFGQTKFTFINKKLSAFYSNIKINAASIKIQLQQKHSLRATWHINIPNLIDVTPFASGSLNSNGSIQGSISTPIISGTLNGADLAWMNKQVDKINSSFILNFKTNTNSKFKLQANNIKFNQQTVKQLNIDLNGNPLKHRIKLNIEAYQDHLSAFLIGQYNDGQWHLNIPLLNLTSPTMKTWRLTQPFEINIGKNNLQIKNLKWFSSTQSIEASINWQKKILQQANIEFKNFSLSLLSPFLANNTKIFGKINLQANYKQNNSKITGNIKANLGNTRLSYLIDGKKQKLFINNGHLTMNLQHKRLQSLLTLNLQKNSFVKASLLMPDFNLGSLMNNKQVSSGKLQINLKHINFFAAFFAKIAELNGHLKTNLSWNGTIKHPNLNGTLSLDNGQASVPDYNLKISHINFQLNAKADVIQYLLDATSGQGKISLTGSSQLTPGYKTSLQITGQNFTIIDTPEYDIKVSPNLKIESKQNKTNINGKIILPKAIINFKNYTDTIGLSNDIIFTQSKKFHKSSQNISSKINLILGDNVHLETNSLNAQLSGSIVLFSNPQNNTKANGELIITKGKFTAFGQELNIKNGKLLYAGGSIDNPGLNVRATKSIKIFVNPTQNSLTQTNLISSSANATIEKINLPMQQKNIVVGINVSNTLKKPHVILFSDQSNLTQADILSYLILGIPISDADHQQGETLWKAAAALNANDSNVGNIISQLKQTFDLNQIGFQSSSFLNPNTNTVQQNTSLVLGKMLSPKLFVRYSIGLIEPINTISASYQLDQHWSAQTEANRLGSGIDLLYSWEQN